MGRIRATTRDERSARRQSIVDAATGLLDLWSPDDVSMDRVARQAGIAKGTVYLYFRTREELLLEVFADLRAGWLDRLTDELRSTRGKIGPAEAGSLTASTLTDSRALLRLFGFANTLFGGNVSPETQYRIRLHHLRRVESMAGVLSERLEGVTFEVARRWLIRFETYVAGVAPRASSFFPSAEIIERPELSPFAVDLESELQYSATTLLLPP